MSLLIISSLLVLNVGLGGAVGGLEDAQVHQPGAAVEFRVDGIDEPSAVCVDGLHDDDTGDLRRLLSRAGREPSDDDGGAGVPDVELLEWNWRLH